MKRICLFISVVLILSFSACGTNYEANSEKDLHIENSQSDIDTSKFFSYNHRLVCIIAYQRK